VNEERLRTLLHQAPVPAADRAAVLAAVRQAFADRERISWPRRHARSLVLGAAGAAVVAAFASPPGRAVLGSLRDAVGRGGVERAQPALVSLPAPGRLLAGSAKGAWIVQPDGSRRLLGRYRDASWSPHGLYVAVTRRDQLLAVEPGGDVRWALARPDVRHPRWTGTRTDTRIAFLSGNRLHLVAGNGTGDVDLCGEPAAADVAPAWRPGPGRVLAYATTSGRVYVLDADDCSLEWRSRRFPRPRLLAWSSDGSRLALVAAAKLVVFVDRRAVARVLPGVSAAAFAPGTHRLAVVQDGRLLLFDADRLAAAPRRIFAGAGRFGEVTWSPDGRWLLLAWPSADQWLFIRSSGVRRLLAYSHIAEQFGRDPRVLGWCCPSD
jgi:hypothetical protein